MMLEEIMKVKCWTRFSKLGFEVEPVEHNIFKIQDNIYVIGTPNEMIQRNLEDKNGPYATMICWAQDDQAVKHAILNNKKIGPPKSKDSQIPKILLSGTDGTYGQIKQLEDSVESASYRIMLDGEFTTKRVRTGSYEYHFLDNTNNEQERCHVIVFHLRE